MTDSRVLVAHIVDEATRSVRRASAATITAGEAGSRFERRPFSGRVLDLLRDVPSLCCVVLLDVFFGRHLGGEVVEVVVVEFSVGTSFFVVNRSYVLVHFVTFCARWVVGVGC